MSIGGAGRLGEPAAVTATLDLARGGPGRVRTAQDPVSQVMLTLCLDRGLRTPHLNKCI